MAFLAAPAIAQVGSWTIRKILPWAIIAILIIGLGGALWVQTDRLGAAKDSLKAMTAKADLYQASADGWQAANAENVKTINAQAADLTKLAADKRQAVEIAAIQQAENEKAVQDLTTRIDQMKARANAHPDQTRDIGPIARDALDWLCGQADGADPTASCR